VQLKRIPKWYFFCLATAIVVPAVAQFGPRLRMHTANQSRPLRLEKANYQPKHRNKVSIVVRGDTRYIQSNGIPDHRTGKFPNRGNPHSIEAQSYEYRVPAKPTVAESPTPLAMQNFGITVTGVPFDPGAAEWYRGQREGGWQYEALAGAVPLGIDENHAHVQPTGAYHYHGLPTALLDQLGLTKTKHSPLVGWAADGFPIYALYGYADPNNAESAIVALKSSFQLKQGRRPISKSAPGGTYDGTFVNDYQFVAKSGDLDECNGRFCTTPEFPEGTYAYFLTEAWPVVPRMFRGTPSEDFHRGHGIRHNHPSRRVPHGFGPPPRQQPYQE